MAVTVRYHRVAITNASFVTLKELNEFLNPSHANGGYRVVSEAVVSQRDKDVTVLFHLEKDTSVPPTSQVAYQPVIFIGPLVDGLDELNALLLSGFEVDTSEHLKTGGEVGITLFRLTKP